MTKEGKMEIIEKGQERYPETGVMPPVQGPMEIIAQAVQRGAGEKELEILERMFEFDLRVKAQAAKEAFFDSFSEFKQNPLELIADKINTHCNNNPYISVGKLLGIVNPELGKHGLIANFRIEDVQEGKLIKVTCILTHKLGHSIESSMSSEPDVAGPKGEVNKTPMHGRMSTVTYLMRATFSAVVGIAAIDKRLDDDGNLGSGAAGEPVDDDKYANLLALLEEVGKSEKFFCRVMKVDSLDKLPDALYEKAIKQLEMMRK